MSQNEQFRELIAQASNGNKEAEKLVRRICSRLCEASPRHSLIKIATFLNTEIRSDALKDSIEGN
jgi:hypothetical protein